MEPKKSAEDTFLQLIRDETGDSSLSFEVAAKMPLATQLLDRIRRVTDLEKTAIEENVPRSKAAVASTTEVPKDVVSPAMLQAAIRHSFDLSELSLTETEREELLASSDLQMIDGKRRLRLKDDARARTLDILAGTDAYNSALRAAIADDLKQRREIESDPIRLLGTWLRNFLSGSFSSLDTAPPSELKAALEARERLRLVKDLSTHVPSVDDIARRVELAELLEPFRLLIGAEGGWDGSPKRDRFVGRDDQLRALRAFVDELSSKSITEGVQRGLARVQAYLGGSVAGILVVEARGGLGKSTLLAKFLLDHAMGQKRPFPFAYLDFDRATLDPTRPSQLLIEIARQVGLQFPQARQQLQRLANNIRSTFLGSLSATEVTDAILDPYAEFVEVVRNHATFGERAFLLVLDTMEAVQWNSLAMSHLSTLISEFRAKGLDELKVVASGRADVPELRRARGVGTAKKNLELEPLKVKEAQAMAEALGLRAIGKEWNSSWSNAVAGKEKETARREPLAIRVVVDLIARAIPEERPKLVGEISSDLDANEDFVARVYFKRIVGHVQHPLAKKLAWPGLVVRRVTEEIIREFLSHLCEIPPNCSQEAFDALAREVWMVTRDGEALKHRQDLRARTLPLMRNAEPKRFADLVGKAVDYFADHRTRSDEDYAEWIYQRLLNGEDPQDVSRDLTEKFLPLLARAADDFKPRSLAASYLASRTATSLLSPSQIQNLQPNDALFHLSRTSANAIGLDDISIDRAAQDVSRRTRGNTRLPSTLNDWARLLWIKTGAWEQVQTQEINDRKMRNPFLRTHLFWAARIVNTFPNKDRERFFRECLEICDERYTQNRERLGIRSGVHLLALARFTGAKTYSQLDREIASILMARKPSPAPSILAALRIAIVLGQESRGPALRLWLASRRRGATDRVQTPSISLSEIAELALLSPDAGNAFDKVISDAGESPAVFTDAEVISTADGMLEEMTFWFENEPDRPRTRALARLFASRDEDWIVPIAYAAERARGSRLSEQLSRQLAFYGRCNKDKHSRESGNDMLARMRCADEAGELVRFANLVLAECNPGLGSTDELRFLLECLNVWRGAIDDVIGRDESRVGQTNVKALTEIVDIRSSPPGEKPPQPGPVLDFEDPQKGRWGRSSAHDGRQVRIVINSVERDIFFFSVIVESTDWTPLAAPVVFHLHDSYPRSVVTIRRVENQQAVLREWSSYGVFAIGVQVKDVAGQWISLEIDLAKTPGLPKRFLDR
jgi:hypothetical protein